MTKQHDLIPMSKPHYLYLFIGECVSQLDKKKIRFVIQTENPITEDDRFKGTVVARAKKAFHPLGFFSPNWCNPIADIKHNLFPSFVRIPVDDCRAMFPDNQIVDYLE